MNRLVLPLAALLFVSCAPMPAGAGIPPIGTAAIPTAQPPATTILANLPPGTRLILRSSSLSLIVDEPGTALAILEQAVADAGGFVSSASSYAYPDSAGYASLSAKVPPEALADLRATALALAASVQSDSTYSQDVTLEYRLMRKRLGELDRAEQHLWGMLTESTDRELAASLMVLREMVVREQETVHSQLVSYDDRATAPSFDVTLHQPLAAPTILE